MVVVFPGEMSSSHHPSGLADFFLEERWLFCYKMPVFALHLFSKRPFRRASGAVVFITFVFFDLLFLLFLLFWLCAERFFKNLSIFC